jgi:hypothetical protein
MSTDGNKFFEPEEIEALSAFFEHAWRTIEKSGDAGSEARETCRSWLAMHVMAIARAGEHDPLQMTHAAVRRYRQQRAQQFAAAFRELVNELVNEKTDEAACG